MSDVRNAVSAAVAALPEYTGIPPENVRVEEVRPDAGDLLVGLSFLVEADPHPLELVESMAKISNLKRKERVFRRFRVQDGQVVAMERVE